MTRHRRGTKTGEVPPQLSKYAWKPGESGNPGGRPKKGYSFSELFEAGAYDEVTFQGETMTRKEFMTKQFSHALVTGELLFLDGRIEELDKKDWDSLMRYFIDRVDGPTTQKLDITTGGQPIGAMNDDQLRAYIEDQVRELGVGASGSEETSPPDIDA